MITEKDKIIMAWERGQGRRALLEEYMVGGCNNLIRMVKCEHLFCSTAPLYLHIKMEK